MLMVIAVLLLVVTRTLVIPSDTTSLVVGVAGVVLLREMGLSGARRWGRQCHIACV